MSRLSSETSEPLVLHIRNLGRVPSKKNDKKIGMRKNGQRYILQNDDTKAWLNAAIRSLESQLHSAYRTAVAMGITDTPQSWIASLLPANDSSKHIKRGSFEIIDVPEGQEGAVITITNLDNETNGVESAQIFGAAYEQCVREERGE